MRKPRRTGAGSSRGCSKALAVAASAAALSASPPAATSRAGEPAPLVVVTDVGSVQGKAVGAAHAFLGVPYAAPPTGELRFRPPVPVAPWEGVLDATALPPACPQLPSVNGPGSNDEDCLHLNVYRPATLLSGAGGGLPVLIWFHGGGLANGSGNQQDATEMAAETGTLVVMVNYRLGVFGFLALASLRPEAADASSGNVGLLDQQAAMAFVQRNAAAFGGDPDNVTIAGQSAGGHSVCLHLASPTAAGLFHRAILHSGAFEVPLSATSGRGPCATLTPAEAEAAGAAFAAAAGCADPATDAGCLRSKSAEELLAASASFSPAPNAGGSVLPAPALEAIAARRWNEVPVVVGSTRDELQTAALLVPGGGFPLDPAVYELIAGVLFGAEAARVLAVYPASDYEDAAYALGAMLTDYAFACPTHALRALLARRTKTYAFEFDDPNAPPGERDGMRTGAYHTADVPYLFDYTPSQGALSPEQERLASEIRRYWAAFAGGGKPEAEGAPAWPRFKRGAKRVLALRPGGSATVRSFAVFHRCRFWESLSR
jgi:para-nitrobenzyl esterase